jgi:hypothetical protein
MKTREENLAGLKRTSTELLLSTLTKLNVLIRRENPGTYKNLEQMVSDIGNELGRRGAA